MLKKLKYKIITTKEIWLSKKSFRVIEVAEDSHIRAQIKSVLYERLRPDSAQHAIVIEGAIEEIIAQIKKSPTLSLTKQLEDIFQIGEPLNQAFWFHSQLAGLTATWEFKVRFLGQKFGISPNTPVEKKSKENRAKKSVQHINLSDTIKEIQRRTGDRLNLRLIELSGLRDAIVHCNPQGIKAYSQSIFGKQKIKHLRGNVVTVSVGSGKIHTISDIDNEMEIEAQELFGWFIEVFNSGLPKKAFDVFDQSIRSIELLTSFAASSFDDRKDAFKKIAIDGCLPSDKDIELFQAYFSLPYYAGPKDAKEYFSKITACFRNLR